MLNPAPRTPGARASNPAWTGWLGQVLLGLALVGAAAEIQFIFRSTWGGLLTWACAATALLGVALVARAELRERPRRFVRKAQRSLGFPAAWSVKLDRRVGEGALIPLAVIRADGVRFVVDIQPHRSVCWGTPTDGTGQTPLVGPTGRRLKPDPVPLLLQAALAASAAPVMWLPQAHAVKNLRHPDSNLIVVMGTARDLKHALQGAEIVPVRPPPTMPSLTPAARMVEDAVLSA